MFKPSEKPTPENKQDETDGKSAISKKPTHVAYQVRDSEDGKGYWNRIGAAWPHGNSERLRVKLHSMPSDGQFILCVATDKNQ